ncbi:MAG TPA: ABC transporter ATP-binding protein [Anaerolineaceae bacterium]|nr:ABC transporter ATP-binding protein [Anaerolineaceae bacterium]
MPAFRKKRQSPDFSREEEKNGSLIELRQVTKAYQTPAGDFLALKNISLSLHAGEFVAVVGKSGSGKSTLINMITGIDRPTSGAILVAGVSLTKLNEDQLAKWRGITIGVVFQFFQLLPTLTVLENVLMPMDFCGKYPPRKRRQIAIEILKQVEMQDCADKLPSAISGGQQQRVALARAIANDPPILIADEPTGNLDSATADAVFKLFEHMVMQGKTVLVVTHDRDLAERTFRIIQIIDGEIQQSQFLNQPESTPHPEPSFTMTDQE